MRRKISQLVKFSSIAGLIIAWMRVQFAPSAMKTVAIIYQLNRKSLTRFQFDWWAHTHVGIINELLSTQIALKI